MSPLTARPARLVGTLLASVALTCATASPAAAVTFIGQDVPTTVTVAPGATALVPWTYRNTGGPGLLPAAGTRVVFTAPGSSTFTAQTTVPSQYSPDGSGWLYNNLGLRNCMLGSGGRTLACEGYGVNGGNSGWPAGSYFRFWPQLTVAADAPAGTTLTPGRGTLDYRNPGSSTDYSIGDGTLNVATPAAAPRPGANAMCLDAAGRADGDNVTIRRCADRAEQRFVVENGRIKSADTVGRPTEMCVAATGTRENGDNVAVRPCVTGGPDRLDQTWVIDRGRVQLADTAGTITSMCLDIGGTRNDGDNARIWECVDHPNQRFVTQDGHLKVEDTLG
ncbi:hypothetical protein F4556_002977 [Kitasatospora gansuensis]|uniref:Ricin B lectin domain-containing protein n=1 Tax=Kitasatospora gansuensis TaxID=258050 RepID=A0A7W7WH69_9ACTN|nr:RICIN domain-containing protein [Kitasatospora gansuensis]MBB4947442.1 hypothetical protein [Kitasatospora gansuensis]